MRLDEIQGYLCAAVVGPATHRRRDRLIDILGSEEAWTAKTGREAAACCRPFVAEARSELAAWQPADPAALPERRATKDSAERLPSLVPGLPGTASMQAARTGSTYFEEEQGRQSRMKSITSTSACSR
jgi:hypothetical protein